MNGYDQIEILYVEDNHQDAELTLHALRKAQVGNHIEWVEDGVLALEFLFREGRYSARSAQQPKLVLLDLKMPRLSGMEVLEKLKSDPRTRMIPVVVLTSSAEEPDIRRCYELGANSYIVKPVEFGNFSEAIARLGMYWMAMNKASN